MEAKTPTIRQNNAFAMQNGLLLGLWSVAAVAALFYGVRHTWLSSLGETLVVLSPFLAALLTIRFRQTVCAPGQGFTFGTAYLHVLMMGLYASVWVAAGVYVYFAYLDGGQFYASCVELLERPEMADAVQQLEHSAGFRQLGTETGATSLEDFLGAFQSLTPATHASSVISLTFLTAPVVSLIIALLTRRRPLGGVRP